MGRIIVMLTAAIALSACNAPRLQDGYQFGDATGTAMDAAGRVLEMRRQYCTTSDHVAKDVLLRSIRVIVPGYPTDGICTDAIFNAQ